jgi:NAD kinase
MILLRQGFGGSILHPTVSLMTLRGINPAKLEWSVAG